jgi:FKBP-type peptidyl-prolyl cis-trans isomerase FklB
MSSAEALNADGNKLYLSGDKKGALEKYSLAIGTDSKVAKYYSNRGQVLLDLGKFHKAAADADKASEMDPTVAKHLFRAGQAYFSLGNFSKALERAQAMRLIDPNCPNAAAIVSRCEEALAQLAPEPGTPQAFRIAGERFLAAKDKDAGVYRLPTGVRISVLRRGPDGAPAKSPTAEDPCTVHYHGTLIDGSVFDSTSKTGQPAEFAPIDVISAWKHVLQLMVPGDLWRIYCPHDQAYGASGQGGVIPPFSVLVFTIELLSVRGTGKPASEARDELRRMLGTPYAELLVVE